MAPSIEIILERSIFDNFKKEPKYPLKNPLSQYEMETHFTHDHKGSRSSQPDS